MYNESNKIVAIIQARMCSTRLPGKVLYEVDGVPLLSTMLKRIEKSKLLDQVIVATSKNPADDQVVAFCKQESVECFRGSENDVLLRYYECANKYNANTIVRLTGDCPLIDPIVIDKVIHFYFKNKVDYAANTVPPETSVFPDGSDVEVFSYSALEKAHRQARSLKDREHVTFYFWKYNKNFTTAQLTQNDNWSKYRFTVDYPEDFEVIEYIIRELIKRKSIGSLDEIIDILNTNPKIRRKNEKYYFGIGWE